MTFKWKIDSNFVKIFLFCSTEKPRAKMDNWCESMTLTILHNLWVNYTSARWIYVSVKFCFFFWIRFVLVYCAKNLTNTMIDLKKAATTTTTWLIYSHGKIRSTIDRKCANRVATKYVNIHWLAKCVEK